jgi:hypothetical protein
MVEISGDVGNMGDRHQYYADAVINPDYFGSGRVHFAITLYASLVMVAYFLRKLLAMGF